MHREKNQHERGPCTNEKKFVEKRYDGPKKGFVERIIQKKMIEMEMEVKIILFQSKKRKEKFDLCRYKKMFLAGGERNHAPLTGISDENEKNF